MIKQDLKEIVQKITNTTSFKNLAEVHADLMHSKYEVILSKADVNSLILARALILWEDLLKETK